MRFIRVVRWLPSGLFDLGREVWDPVLLELSTITENLLGRVCWASEVVGRVTRDAADFTGPAEGTVVVAGSADHPGYLLGAAFVAGKGAGVFKKWSDIERFISVGETIEANLATHERCQ